MIITGYRIDGTDIRSAEEKLKKVKERLKKMAEKIYYEKLGKEIAFLCDNIALNILQKNSGEDIFSSAVGNLDILMKNAELTSAAVDYNFQVYSHIMIYDGYTYLKVICPNKKLLSAFKSLYNYSLSESECQDQHNQKNIVWQKLHAIYGNTEPLSINLSPHISIKSREDARDKIKYPTLDERCLEHARYNLQSRILNQISGGEQIPPFRMMSYLDIAMKLILEPDAQREIREKAAVLSQTLPDLNKDDSVVFGPAADLKEKNDCDDILDKAETETKSGDAS